MKMDRPPQFDSRITRRRILKKGFFGSIFLSLFGGGWLAMRPPALRAVPDGLRVLSADEYAVLWALCQRMLPSTPAFPSPDSVDAVRNCDAILAASEASAQSDMRHLLMLFENALPNFLLGGRITPFTHLAAEEQDEVLREWAHSALTFKRTGYVALKTLVSAGYFGHPHVWAAMHATPPPQGAFNASAPVWKGGGVPRPPGNGVFVETNSENAR